MGHEGRHNLAQFSTIKYYIQTDLKLATVHVNDTIKLQNCSQLRVHACMYVSDGQDVKSNME